ncbi:multidrug effflux MFS transporter [Novosphingobium album (ex Liu et al. 2023)]|uniref:Multidrug effflux MFS transporter n=1 Tax=Novosphingobium album (ex Liu et al. 2023) TaxID=3031130 RepID=A0ABT5WJQ2_9SPHN|nr:multidrug effflux MFS transporter [Novosphingobium album (ex Liu et al. 2023)]MDE8650273.1 multidrug effflux MFS transporter [Novosphingobium album (ex Liu et al. 2023)]
MREIEFVGLMAALQALQALAIDVMLPALGHIARDLGQADPNQRQLIVGVFLLCSGLGSLFPGSISDRFGRKPVVMVCLAAYFCISLACALVTDFATLLILRGFLGLFTSGLMVLPMAVIRDRYSGDRMARTQSLVAMVFMVVPMIAPMLGQGLLLFANWRWIFGLMAGLAGLVAFWAWMRLPETLHPEFRQGIAPRAILGNMRAALLCRAAAGYFLGAALVQGAMFGYINSAQQLIAEHFGAGTAFPVVFGVMALIMSGTNFINSRIVERFGARRVSHTAMFGFILIATIHFAIALRGETLWVFAPLMTVSFCLMSFIGANFQSIALQPFARTAGAAASVMTFVRMVLGAAFGSLIGQAYDGTARPLLGAMVAAGIGALGFVLFSERGRLFRRLNYPPGLKPAR